MRKQKHFTEPIGYFLGVSQIYLYDTSPYDNHTFYADLKSYIDDGFITYVRSPHTADE